MISSIMWMYGYFYLIIAVVTISILIRWIRSSYRLMSWIACFSGSFAIIKISFRGNSFSALRVIANGLSGLIGLFA